MKLAIATLLVGSAASSSIRSNSRVGKRLLSKARRLDGNDDMSWAADYSLQFQKCATTTDYYGGYFGGDGNNNNNRNNYNGLYEQRLVHFSLCPQESCGSDCTGGADYVVDMNEFVQAYTEYKMEAMERECENVKENCDCENANDDEMCEMQCYKNEGLYDQCVEQDAQNNNNNNGNNGNNGQQEEEFQLEEVLECARLDVDEDAVNYYNYQNGNYNGNNNRNNQQQEVEYFVGPYCSANGKSILLGVFMDEVCSYAAPDGTYEKFNYGKAMPYSSESIVTNECISCERPDDDANNNGGNYYYRNNNKEKEVLQFCEEIYEDAGKCETDLDAYGHYANTMACEFIEGLKASGKTRIFSALAEASSNVTPKVLAGVFAVTTLVFGGVAVHFHKKLQRQSVGLVHGEGSLA